MQLSCKDGGTRKGHSCCEASNSDGGGDITYIYNMISLYEILMKNKEECLAGNRGALEHLMVIL